MPYTLEEKRRLVEPLLQALEDRPELLENEGDLNHYITNVCAIFLKQHLIKYGNFADIEGVLNHVSKEFYRRLAIPYEDKKIEQNGDLKRLKELEDIIKKM